MRTAGSFWGSFSDETILTVALRRGIWATWLSLIGATSYLKRAGRREKLREKEGEWGGVTHAVGA